MKKEGKGVQLGPHHPAIFRQQRTLHLGDGQGLYSLVDHSQQKLYIFIFSLLFSHY